MINMDLAKERGLSEDTIKEIEEYHRIREFAIGKMRKLKPNDRLVKVFYRLLVEIEYKLQSLWGFDQDDTFHNLHGNHIPHCKCPTIDNKERIGSTNTRIINCDCPVHGGVNI